MLRQKNPPPTKSFLVRFPPEVHEELKFASARLKLSMNQLIVKSVQYAMYQAEKKLEQEDDH